MSAYKLGITYYFDGYITEHCDIYPEDFLDCENEDELEDAIYEYSHEESEGDWGAVNCNSIYDSDYVLPEGFVEEWRLLKAQTNEEE